MDEILERVVIEARVEDCCDFEMLLAINMVRWGMGKVQAMFICFMIGQQERSMEDQMDLPR